MNGQWNWLIGRKLSYGSGYGYGSGSGYGYGYGSDDAGWLHSMQEAA